MQLGGLVDRGEERHRCHDRPGGTPPGEDGAQDREQAETRPEEGREPRWDVPLPTHVEEVPGLEPPAGLFPREDEGEVGAAGGEDEAESGHEEPAGRHRQVGHVRRRGTTNRSLGIHHPFTLTTATSAAGGERSARRAPHRVRTRVL